MTEQLAIEGGAPVIAGPLPRFRSMGAAEAAAVAEVMASDCLSGFYGSPGDEYFGGPQVQAFEAAWRERFGVTHAVSVNSATSGLIAAMGAIGISPGDEVIVPPTTMSATAMAPLFYGGIPVFADIEDETFCLDSAAVLAAITPRTRAILAVNLFGHPARLTELRALADARGLFLVEDNAQAPLGAEAGRACGSIGHVGVFSLNYHKHLHTGEGGVCVTQDAGIARRLAMIRNHGENAVGWLDESDAANLIGQNYRLTELGAAIGRVQLGRIDELVASREALAEALSDGLSNLAGITVPRPRAGCRHNYYAWTLRFDAAAMGCSRDAFSAALAAEGFPHAAGYVRPLYYLPVFQQRRALGRDGWPFSLTDRTYPADLCPVAERLHRSEFLLFEPCAYDVDAAGLEALIEAFRKTHRLRHRLKG